VPPSILFRWRRWSTSSIFDTRLALILTYPTFDSISLL
jgi:hypothetical protein